MSIDRQLLRLTCLRAQNSEPARGNSPQKSTPGLHMHLAADNFVYVNHKLWSRNANGILSRN